KASMRYLETVIGEVRPDVLHLNQYCHGGISAAIPRMVVAHSDVLSWWVAVHGEGPPESAWMHWYRDTVRTGLQSADLVVAPSQWMLDRLRMHYGPLNCGRVIHNGRDPAMFDADRHKEEFVLSVGRQWDAGKQTRLLMECDHVTPICIVGAQQEPGRRQSEREEPDPLNSTLQVCGALPHHDLRALYARAAIYVATSRYEPFGLAPLEAALSRCALVLNDIPVFHELWGDAAFYFHSN